MADTASEAVAPSAPETKQSHPPPPSALSAADAADATDAAPADDPSDPQPQQQPPFDHPDRMNVDSDHQALHPTGDGPDIQPETVSAQPTVGADDPATNPNDVVLDHDHDHDGSRQLPQTDPAVKSDPKPTAQPNPSEDVDAELEAMKIRLQQMEQETLGMHSAPDATDPQQTDSEDPSLNQLQSASSAPPHNNSTGPALDETTAESDARSVYVGNVDYKATGEELNEYFKDCGTINRVTIMCHKPTGNPKGFAYIEFTERESVQNALILNDSMFRGRQLKVVEKRTNIPAVHRGGGFSRGRPRYQRGGWRAGYQRRPRGRGRTRGRWAPY